VQQIEASLRSVDVAGESPRFKGLDEALRPRLTYANVASTLALFLASAVVWLLPRAGSISGGIAPGAVGSSDLHARAVSSGKLAIGGVRTNQIADGAVGAAQLARGLIDSIKSAAGSATVTLDSQPPFSIQASPTGGSLPLPEPGQPAEYPLTDASGRRGPARST
jgi:hypothetical protein